MSYIQIAKDGSNRYTASDDSSQRFFTPAAIFEPRKHICGRDISHDFFLYACCADRFVLNKYIDDFTY